MMTRCIVVLIALLSVCSVVSSFRLPGFKNGVSSSRLYVSDIQNSDSSNHDDPLESLDGVDGAEVTGSGGSSPIREKKLTVVVDSYDSGNN